MKAVILGVLAAALVLAGAVVAGGTHPATARQDSVRNPVIGTVRPDTPHGTLPTP